MGVVRDRSLLIAIIGGVSVIVAAVAKPILEAVLPVRPSPAPTAVAATGDPITPTPATIEGAWKQYVLSPQEGAVYIGTFVVSKHRGEYLLSPRAQSAGERFQTSIGVFDVVYDGRTWTFNSNWGGGDVGNFALQRVSPTVFEGEIRVAGQLSNRTRFVKIE
jgi:hypothetical protein